MCEATPESVGSVVLHEQIAAWASLIRADGLTPEGLAWLRSRLASLIEANLACQHGEQVLRPCPMLLALLLHVIDRLAPHRGIEPADDDLYSRIVPLVPDTPAGAEGPGTDRW